MIRVTFIDRALELEKNSLRILEANDLDQILDLDIKFE
jgi:hypothetical protein